MRAYVRPEGNLVSRKCTNKIKLTFAIYAVKDKVVGG